MSCRPHQRQVAAPKYRVASLLFFVYHTMVKFRYEHLYQYERGSCPPFLFGTAMNTPNLPRSPPCKRPKTDKRDFAAIASVASLRFQVLSPAPENDKFRQKLVVFSYIRLTASYMHLRCVIFASQVICLRALGANIISLKP